MDCWFGLIVSVIWLESGELLFVGDRVESGEEELGVQCALFVCYWLCDFDGRVEVECRFQKGKKSPLTSE